MPTQSSHKLKGKSKGSGSGSHNYPSRWSDWAWIEDSQREERYRLIGPDNYEYQCKETESEDSPVPRAPLPVAESHDPQDVYQDAQPGNYTHAQYGQEDQGSRAETINEVDQTTSLFGKMSVGPSVPDESAITASPYPAYPEASPYPQVHIKARDRHTKVEKFDPHYKVHRAKEFTWGRIFKVLWAEPSGGGKPGSTDDTKSMRVGKHGENIYEKVRRFLIVSPMEGHCICLPINTYTGRGVNKSGVHAEHHTIIHTEKEPWYADGEWEKGLTRTPIRAEPTSLRHKLDPMSRLNYAKLYTVEYNVKVWFVGKVHHRSERDLIADYNDVHPPMTGGISTTIPEETTTYAGSQYPQELDEYPQ